MRISKLGWIIAAATLATGSTAFANSATSGEVGYATGALGYDALVAGDLTRAETQLDALHGVRANDPARLINLANVYMRTGRIAAARNLLVTARDSHTQFDVELANGEVVSTREVARRALARMERMAQL